MDDFIKRARAEASDLFGEHYAQDPNRHMTFLMGADWARGESEVLKAEIKQLKAEIDDRQVDRDALYLVRQDYKSLKTDFLHKTEHLCMELGKKDVEIERLEAELEQVKAALSRRNTRNLELKAELDDRTYELSSANATISELEAELERVNEAIDTLKFAQGQAAFGESWRTIAAQKYDFDALKAELERVTDRKAAVEDLERECHRLTEENDKHVIISQENSLRYRSLEEMAEFYRGKLVEILTIAEGMFSGDMVVDEVSKVVRAALSEQGEKE